MDYEKLKEVIAKQIKENGRREITGPVLQAVLMAMVDSLGEVYPQTYTDEEKAQARANIDALSNYDGEITKEKLSLEVQAILNDVANKQNITDESLATIAKTIVGAINELFNGGVKDKSIATSKIKDGAITDAKIASGAVTTEKVNDGAITEPKLDTDLVNVITSAVQPAELASAIATALASYVAKADIVDTTGSATDKVISQHGVTEAINGVTDKVTDLDSKTSAINLRNYTFSTNNEVNKYIKEVYVPSLPSGFAKGFITIMIGMKSSSTGLYFNVVRLGNDRSVYVEILFEKGFASIEDAISAATNYHIESTEEGAYCVVDFSSISSAFSKRFELEHYDVEKLYNSPTIAQLLLDKTNDEIDSNEETINSIITEDSVFSTNKELNELVKEAYVASGKPLGKTIGIIIAQFSSSFNKYYNGVICGDNFIFYDAQYTTEQEAVSAAQSYSGILEYEGDYLIVDFSKITGPLSKAYEAPFKDLTKLYNSPKIEEYLHDKEVSNIKEDVSNLKEDLGEISVLETIKPIVVGIQYGEIVSNGKINIGTSGTYKISEKINVSKGDIIKIVGSGYNTLMIAEYKAGTEPTPLSFIGGTPCENRVVKEYEYVCQENGYVLLCWASVYANVETYTHIKAGKINALNYKIEASNVLNNPNKPLNILIFGDSISDSASIEVSEESLSAVTTSYSLPYNGNSFVVNGETIRYSMWPALLRRLFNVFDIRCYARYGATYINDSRNTIFRQNLSEQIALALNDLSNPNGVFMTNGSFEPDIVIFALSANDSNTPTDTYEIAMGKTIMSENGNSFDVDATLANLDLTQFNQAVRYAFLKMKRQFPYALFFAIVPPQRSAYDIGETQKEKDLRRMAERYSIQIIDAAATCGILRDLEIQGSVDVYSKDGLHPNNKGQNLYARMVANAIKNSLIDMTLLNE